MIRQGSITGWWTWYRFLERSLKKTNIEMAFKIFPKSPKVGSQNWSWPTDVAGKPGKGWQESR